MQNTTWSCRCGDVELAVKPAGGTRAVCYCDSCRNFVKHLGSRDILDSWGGDDLFQIAPEAATFVKGADKVAWTKMTPKGPARWFTTCCKSPLANSLETRAIPFLTLQSAYVADKAALGAIDIRVFRKGADGRVPDTKGGQARLLWEFAKRALKSRLTGGWRRNPLFNGSGRPIANEVPMSTLVDMDDATQSDAPN